MAGRKILRRLPGTSIVFAQLDALRDERDRLRAGRARLRRDIARLRTDRDEWKERAVALDRGAVLAAERSGPSLLSRTETLRRVRAISRERFGVADSIWDYNGKLEAAAMARSLGLRTPTSLVGPTDIDELEPPDTDQFTVKPLRGATARGVTPLVATDGRRYLDLFAVSQPPAPWEVHRERLATLAKGGKISRQFFVEELLPGPHPTALPYDWKFLCIGGRVALSYARDTRNQRSPQHSRFRYWSPDWEDLGPIRSPEKVDPGLPPPNHPAALIEAAERVASWLLPTVFVRVDLYDPPAGVVFGEITPQPGAPLWFGDELDRQLGSRWDEYEAASWAARTGEAHP